MILAGLLLILAALTTRMLLGAREQLARASASNSMEERIRHLRRAMAYYIPGNPWVRRAHDTLLGLARNARRTGDDALALHAYRQLRASILALRGLTRPYDFSLNEANTAIATLAVRETETARAPARAATSLLERLEHPPEPSPGWAGLGLVGFILWVCGALVLFFHGLRPDLTLARRRFWPLLLLVVLGLGLFSLGMGLA